MIIFVAAFMGRFVMAMLRLAVFSALGAAAAAAIAFSVHNILYEPEEVPVRRRKKRRKRSQEGA